MTKFTKQQLGLWAEMLIEESRTDAALCTPGGEEHESYEAQRVLLEIALAVLTAGMEQEPVAYIADCGTIVSDGDPFFDDYKNPQPLYAAPQLPQPAVGDGRAEFEAWMLKQWGRERKEDDFRMGKFLHGENYAESYTRHMWKSWLASRAAMLAAVPQQKLGGPGGVHAKVNHGQHVGAGDGSYGAGIGGSNAK
ncbi:hypothetical protein [Citrobacter portucalensis]|uniref:hypothetical protein n=1 Tax=Citrobacter portucalensis TaxID=1639133 RepID=UPI002242E794|nr:hypothetical protein [Citrobacter portucalensis]MCW8354072.1 hypothetical protein [Citrobacter portucalensis]MCX9044609.1 hypothetical protein [Citrobacter portucalensis]